MHSSSAALGIVPFENSSNGSVLHTLDLLIDKEYDFPDTHVCAEAYLDVEHCLLGRSNGSPPDDDDQKSQSTAGNTTLTMSFPYPRAPRSKPLTDLHQIKRIYSHPQAFGQSQAFLSTYLPLAKRYEVSSTSEAAKIVARDDSNEAAALASRFAAVIHGLDILAEGIQDIADNTTRFLVIQKGPLDSDHSANLPDKLLTCPESDQNLKALVSFSINHEIKGALADVLEVFRKHELNLKSINSRPSRIRPWHYVFLVEFEGKEQLRDPDLLRVAFEDLKSTTQGNKWLGCWTDRSAR